MKLNNSIALNMLFVGSFLCAANPNVPKGPKNSFPESPSECLDSPGHFGKCVFVAGVSAGAVAAGAGAAYALFCGASTFVTSISVATGLSKTVVTGGLLASSGGSAVVSKVAPANEPAPQQQIAPEFPVMKVQLMDANPPVAPVRSFAQLSSSVNQALPTPGHAIIAGVSAGTLGFIGAVGYGAGNVAIDKALGVKNGQMTPEEREKRHDAEQQVEWGKINEQDVKHQRMIAFEMRRLEGRRNASSDDQKE
jgi:hypothetical protein